MDKEKKAITEVEDFIKSLHDGDIVILPEAKKLVFNEVIGKTTLGRPKKVRKSLADALAYAMAVYQAYRDVYPPSLVIQKAYECLDLIERCRTHGVIKNQNLTDKLKRLKRVNEQLEQQISSLRELNKRLAKENKELKIFANSFGGKRFSDVTE
jgi:hypothetical protein